MDFRGIGFLLVLIAILGAVGALVAALGVWLILTTSHVWVGAGSMLLVGVGVYTAVRVYRFFRDYRVF